MFGGINLETYKKYVNGKYIDTVAEEFDFIQNAEKDYNSEIQELKRQLEETDYYFTKNDEAEILNKEAPYDMETLDKVGEKRDSWRNEINSFQKLMSEDGG